MNDILHTRGRKKSERARVLLADDHPAVVRYVLKLAAGEELVPAIHAALRAERHVSPIAGSY